MKIYTQKSIRRQPPISNFLSNLIIVLTKGLVFCLPLFFLPWTFEFFEFNKQYLLWLIAPLIAILWLIKAVIDKSFSLKRTPLDVPILIFLGVAGLSVVFSIDKFSSLFGFYGRFSDAWLGLLSLVLFYFILINVCSAKSRLNALSLIKLLLLSYSAVVVVGLSAISGYLGAIFDKITHFDMAWLTAVSFNLIGGTLEALAIFTSIISVLLIGLLVFIKKPDGKIIIKKWQLWFGKILLTLSIILLALINFTPAWLCFLAGALFILIIYINLSFFNNFKLKPVLENSKKEDGGQQPFTASKRSLISLIVLILLIVVFLIFPNINLTRIIAGQDSPQEIRLDYKSAFSIANKSFRNNWLLGSGPGTFSYDFSLYRHKDFNQSRFWQFRFDKAPSHILEMIVALGSLGLLSYFLILSPFFYLAFLFCKKFLSVAGNNPGIIISLIAAFIAVFLAQIIYLANTSLLFLFWLLLGLIMVVWRDLDYPIFRENNIKLDKLSLNLPFIKFNFFQSSSQRARQKVKLLRIFPAIALVIIAGWLILAGYEIKYWLADTVYAKSPVKEVNLVKAIRLNPNRFNYQVGLAKFYLNQVKAAILNLEEKKDNKKIQASINSSINWAKQAAATAPNSVVAHETLGMVYRDVRLLTRGSEPWAVRSFAKASGLEPSNPVLLTELGRAYLNDGNLTKAVQSFNQALELKNNYLEAKLALAKAYARSGNQDEAIVMLDDLLKITTGAEIYYEQGRIYYNEGEIKLAINKFLKALELEPNHLNTLYSLALAYELEEEWSQALAYFKKVLKLNPGNADVINRINTLEGN